VRGVQAKKGDEVMTVIQLDARQDQLSALADEIRASGAKNPAAMQALARVLASKAQLEVELSGKAKTYFCNEQEDDDLPF